MNKFKGTTEQAFVTAARDRKFYKFVFNLDINNLNHLHFHGTNDLLKISCA